MRSIFRSTAILGGSSVIGLSLGLITSKVLAVWIGPAGLGYLSLLQSLLLLASTTASLGIGIGLVRLGANALERDEMVELAALRKAAVVLSIWLAAAAWACLWIFRVRISEVMLGGRQHASGVAILGLAVAFWLMGAVLICTLNAYHRVGLLGKCAVATNLITTILSVILVIRWRIQAVLPIIIIERVVQTCVALYFVRTQPGLRAASCGLRQVLTAMRSLLHFGVPYTCSTLIGAATETLLPIMVLRALNIVDVGFYKAGATISVSYLGILLVGMGQDYYPRVAALKDQPDRLREVINQQQRLVMLLGVPIILATLALAPFLVTIVYSSKFSPVVELLEWQLIGDIFKFSSWTMSYAILACTDSATYFIAQVALGVVMLGFSYFALRWFGLNGMGIGFVATYIVYSLVLWVLTRSRLGLYWTKENKLLMLAAIAAVCLVRVLPFWGLRALRTPIALSLALAWGAASVYWIRLDMRSYTSDTNIMSTS